jgi:hypothetical protein
VTEVYVTATILIAGAMIVLFLAMRSWPFFASALVVVDNRSVLGLR